MATRPVGPQYVSVDEYDVLVYPGFLRRSVRRGQRVVCIATAVVWRAPLRAQACHQEAWLLDGHRRRVRLWWWLICRVCGLVRP